MLEAIEATLRRWVSSGQVSPMNARIAAELQFGLVEAALCACFLERGGGAEGAYVREVTRALRTYLGQEV